MSTDASPSDAPAWLLLHPQDDVAVARRVIASGELLVLPGGTVCAQEAIPAGHKVALRALPQAAPVRKYGQVIGLALCNIAAGTQVHVHNLAVAPPEAGPAPGSRYVATRRHKPEAMFQGYVRADCRVGTRNYVGVIASVNCSATVCKAIARAFEGAALRSWPGVDGVVALTHGSGCGMSAAGEGIEVLRRTLRGHARHPNFAAVLVVGLGCEVNQVQALVSGLNDRAPGRVRTLDIQAAGGTHAAVAQGQALVREMLDRACSARRTRVSARHLVVGLQCGGSDGYSGISANPALGAAVDLLVSHGGTAILSETPEIYGAEHLLTARAASPEVAERLLQRLHWWQAYAARHGSELNNNPSPGNKAGGISTILEKSLGAVAKGGTSGLMAVLEYAEPVRQRGLVFMDTPGFDPVSATGQVAGGANLICFTTGRGSTYGNKPVPSIKLATNTEMYQRLRHDMDHNCGAILDGTLGVAEAGEQIFALMLATASGRSSLSEQNGLGEHEFVPWQLGAVL